MGVRFAIICGGISFLGAAIVVVLLMQTLASRIPAESQDVIGRGWAFGLAVAAVFGLATAGAAFATANAVGTRLNDLMHAVGKLGRSSSDVRVRVDGNDEVTAVQQAVSGLAADLATIAQEKAGGSTPAHSDPQVRALRDKVQGDLVGRVEGFETDGAIANGFRGGLDHFGLVEHEGKAIVYAISAGGSNTASVMALRTARDEILRALNSGASARKALAHTNRVINRTMPQGVCAKACLLELGQTSVKLYQAGYRTPLWICAAGEVLELNAEGLALGLDAGPVFEKGLRPEDVDVSPGYRLVLTNDAGHASQDFLDLIQEHSPKNTGAFMSLVLGGVEGDDLAHDLLLLTAKRYG